MGIAAATQFILVPRNGGNIVAPVYRTGGEVVVVVAVRPDQPPEYVHQTHRMRHPNTAASLKVAHIHLIISPLAE